MNTDVESRIRDGIQSMGHAAQEPRPFAELHDSSPTPLEPRPARRRNGVIFAVAALAFVAVTATVTWLVVARKATTTEPTPRSSS